MLASLRRAVMLAMAVCLSVTGTRAALVEHRFKLLTSQRVKSVMRCHEMDSLFDKDLPAILKPRVPGTASHAEVKQYILSRLRQLDCSRWTITEHSFTDRTPYGDKPFTNIIATLDPERDRRLVLAAHYDSKIISGGEFLGATDSAFSVALLLDVALALDEKLRERELSEVSLQLIFFDGEEAFERWTSTDSLYGSRRLARDMSEEGGLLSTGDKTGIEAITSFVLLDLIGAAEPSFLDMYQDTTVIFQRLMKIEKRLHEAGHLESHRRNYFQERTAWASHKIGDDHEPFKDRGVPVVHLITFPFPTVWHKLSDNLSAIDRNLASNFKKILMVFLHEYFHLR